MKALPGMSRPCANGHQWHVAIRNGTGVLESSARPVKVPANSRTPNPPPAVNRTRAAAPRGRERHQRPVDVHKLLIGDQERLGGQRQAGQDRWPDPNSRQASSAEPAATERPEHGKPDSRLGQPAHVARHLSHELQPVDAVRKPQRTVRCPGSAARSTWS